MTVQEMTTQAYISFLRSIREKGYPVGVRENTARETALTDWEVAACLPDSSVEGPVTVGAVRAARKAAQADGVPIRSVGHRYGDDTYQYVADAPSTSPVASTPDQDSLFDE